jgi:NitT/TauT family transport system permease protein
MAEYSREAEPALDAMHHGADEDVGIGLVRKVEHEAHRRRHRDWLTTLGIRVALVAGFIVLWEVLSGPVLDPFFFSRPTDIAEQVWKWIQGGQLVFHLQFTLAAMVAGYLLGVAVGLSLAIVFGLVYYLYRVTEPVVLIIYSIPSVAIGPLLIIWFGIGMLPKIILAAFFVFFVVFMNTVTGIRNTNASLIDIALVMGASRREIITKIVLPGAYPYIVTALRITLPSALIGAVVGEFVSSNRGIAYLIMESSLRFNTAGTFGALIVLGIVVVLLNSVLTPLESRLLRHLPKVEAVQ